MIRVLWLLLSFLCFSPVIYSSVSSNSDKDKKGLIQHPLIVSDLNVVGNKTTRKHIILREVPVKAGDTIDINMIGKAMQSARQNLLNTSLFNFVTVDTVPVAPGKVQVLVAVTERWYTWPVPIFEIQERNFNEWWIDKDFEKVNYGFFLNRENFRGRKEDLSVYAQFGYTEKYGFSYKIPYISRKQRMGLGMSFSYARNHEIPFKTVDNHQVYIKDPDQYLRQELSTKINTTWRPGIHHSHYFELRFTDAFVHDTIQDITFEYFPGNSSELKFFSLDYSFRRDFRDAKSYPLKGHFVELEIQRMGLGLLKGEDLNATYFYLTARQYKMLSNRIYAAGGVKLKYGFEKAQPYYTQRGLGWRDFVRGYEYYVIDAQRYGVAKLGLRYEVIKPHVQSIPLPLNKFNKFHYALYAGIFGDMGYGEDLQFSALNPLANTFLYGYGVGVDYVTYYDVVVRFEYSMNHLMEHGLFIHFSAGI